MSTKSEMPEAARREAIVLQCLFASVSKLPPTVGEVVAFCNKHCSCHSTPYQINRVLADLKARKMVTVKAERHGSKVWSRWSITPNGALLLLASTRALPKHIRDYMDALHSRVAAGANMLIQEYFEQGVTS